MLPIRTVLHPTDYSEHSRQAFELACAIGRDYGASVVVCHVSPPPVVGVDAGVELELPTGWAEEAEERLRAVRPADPRVRVSYRLARGGAATEIVKLAAAAAADLIVMGTHGRSGVSRLLVGSVAEAVMRNVPCPVVTVRSPFPAAG